MYVLRTVQYMDSLSSGSSRFARSLHALRILVWWSSCLHCRSWKGKQTWKQSEMGFSLHERQVSRTQTAHSAD